MIKPYIKSLNGNMFSWIQPANTLEHYNYDESFLDYTYSFTE